MTRAAKPLINPSLCCLRKHGWIDGRNLIIEYHFSQPSDRLPASVAELIAFSPDVLVAAAGAAARYAAGGGSGSTGSAPSCRRRNGRAAGMSSSMAAGKNGSGIGSKASAGNSSFSRRKVSNGMCAS